MQLQWWSRSRFGVAGGEKQGPGLEVEAGNETDPCFGVQVNKPQTGFWRGGVSRFWGALLLKGQAEGRHMQVLYLRAAGPVAGLSSTATRYRSRANQPLQKREKYKGSVQCLSRFSHYRDVDKSNFFAKSKMEKGKATLVRSMKIAQCHILGIPGSETASLK
jgi:hypothetical protein